jgi:hypothetical protein
MLAVGILVKSFGTFFVYLPYDSLSNCVVPFFFCRGNHSQMVLFLSSLFVAGNIVKSYLTGTSFCSVSYGYLQCFGSGSCESVNTGNWPRSGSVDSELWNRIRFQIRILTSYQTLEDLTIYFFHWPLKCPGWMWFGPDP